MLHGTDCVVIVTDHTGLDYQLVAREAKLVVDTRHALPAGARRKA
jgi:UDP-N-acetyl-D-glucosamine dehydrogenase